MHKLLVGLILLVSACSPKVNVNPAQVSANTVQVIFANLGKPAYQWVTEWGTFGGNILEVQDSSTQISRYELSEDLLSGNRDIYTVQGDKIVVVADTTVTRTDLNGDWVEVARQTYTPPLPIYSQTVVNIGGGEIENTGRWTWADNVGHTGAGDFEAKYTWKWNGSTYQLEEWWNSRTDGDPAGWNLSDHILLFTPSKGFIGLFDQLSPYAVCQPKTKCVKI